MRFDWRACTACETRSRKWLETRGTMDVAKVAPFFIVGGRPMRVPAYQSRSPLTLLTAIAFSIFSTLKKKNSFYQNETITDSLRQRCILFINQLMNRDLFPNYV